jgi:KDO2-lipid IV(A) lauroyltransferase
LARLIFASALDGYVQRHAWLRALLFRLESYVVLVFWWSFRALSPERAARLGGFALGMLGPLSAKATMVKANLGVAFPELDAPAIDALARRTWRSVGRVFGEYPHLDRIAREDRSARLEMVDHCNLGVYRRRERQAIFVGAHLSNWEIMALALARSGVPLLALHAPLQNPHLAKLMDRARAQLGCKMLGRGESMRALIHQIREGGSIGLLLDLSMKDGVPVPFFGQPMRTTLTPARMAQRYGCDIVPMRTERLGEARFRVTAYPPIRLDSRGTDEADRAIAITRQLNMLMETWIREQPGEWLCASRRWEKDLYRALPQNPLRPARRRMSEPRP